MVDCVGRYYRKAFQGFRGITQGDLLSLTISSVALDALVRHWVSLLAVGSGCPDGWGREVLHCSTFFYADNALVVYTDPEWIQGTFLKIR